MARKRSATAEAGQREPQPAVEGHCTVGDPKVRGVKKLPAISIPSNASIDREPSLADAYISVGGRLPRYNLSDVSRDLVAVSSFILHHQDDDMIGGITAADAYEALCRLIDIPAAKVRSIVRPTANGPDR